MGLTWRSRLTSRLLLDLMKIATFATLIGFKRTGQALPNTLNDFRLEIPLAVDSTGVGDPIGEELARGRYVDLIKFTQQSKQQMMEGLAVKIQKGEVGFPDGHVRDELDSFEYEYTHTGVKLQHTTGTS